MIVYFFMVAALAAGLTLLQLKFAARPFVDTPNDRSSHNQPTPGGGGLAIFLAFTLAYLFFINQGLMVFWLPALVLIPLFGIGLLDDLKPVSAVWRFVIQLLVVAGLLLLIPLHSSVLSLSIWFVSIVWWLNLFNFMDGTDGLANGESIFICLALLLLSTDVLGGGQSILLPEHYFLLLLLACGWGFMVFNAAPARIFMGDAGSLFIAGLLAAVACSLFGRGLISGWTILILVAVFAADATMTLLMRALRREKLTQAHRSHFYQGLARKWGDHQKVAILYSLINVFYLLPLAVWANQGHSSGLLLAVIAYFPLCLIVIISHRRFLTIQ